MKKVLGKELTISFHKTLIMQMSPRKATGLAMNLG